MGGGNIVGEHSVIFAGDNGDNVISFNLESEIFVKGAMLAARWLGKDPYYSMDDVLNIEK